MSELKIVAKIGIKQEYTSELLETFHMLVDATRKEEGNVSYTLNQSINNASEYTILEVWKSKEAIDFHNQTPHFEAFKKAIDGKIESLSIDVIKTIY